MNPLPDRVVILSVAITVLMCFAVAVWTARLNPPSGDTLIWRSSPTAPKRPSSTPFSTSLPPDGV